MMLLESATASKVKISINETYEFLPLAKPRYVHGNRRNRAQFLGSLERITGLHRKSLTGLTTGSLERKPHKRQRKCCYRADAADALCAVDENPDHICADRSQ